MSLEEYNLKRNFALTPEPDGGEIDDRENLVFVIQKHAASHLHYDFRLEMGGVLKSWAIPKGPSTDPATKRLAMMVEDHPYGYKNFEGNIPASEYGGGSVIIWDKGTYEPIAEITGKSAKDAYLREQLKAGSLKIKLHGSKLNGEFALVKTKGMGSNGWLLIKHRDSFASDQDITMLDRSVKSGRDLLEVASGQIREREMELPAPDSTPQLSRGNERVKKGNENIKPMLATLIDNPFDSPEWQFEVKLDGYRALSYLNNGAAQILSRNLKSFNEKFPPIYQAMKELDLDAVLDGEIVVLNNSGVSDFSALQNWRGNDQGKLVYYIFDILRLNGSDLTALPLSKRRAILEKTIPRGQETLRLGTVYKGSGLEAFKRAEENLQEGIVAKRLDSTYTPGKRSHDWLKIKVHRRQEVVIAGYTKIDGSPRLFSSLLLGVYEETLLRYAGKVGTGFSEKTEKEIMDQLTPLQTKANPFSEILENGSYKKLNADISLERVTWLLPELVCEVSFSEVTKDGFFRHPSFKGMRIDKQASLVSLEDELSSEDMINEIIEDQDKHKSKPAVDYPISFTTDLFTLIEDDKQITVNGHQLDVSHLNKIYWPKEGISKRDMLNYYHQIAPYILPYLKDRPLSLNRFPNGTTGPSFYQKDVSGKSPQWVKTFPYTTAEGLMREYPVGSEEDTLLWMASLGCIEMNPWFSRVSQPDRPDYAVIDLDPDNHNSFQEVVKVALEVKNILDSISIMGFCKTSGSTGIHVYIPLGAKYTFAQSQSLIKAIVDIVNMRMPELTTLKRMVGSREGKMYLDFLQNKPAATIASPYSLRPKPGGPVSTPLQWDELMPGLSMYDFNIVNTLERLKSKGDLFKGVLGEGIDLEQALIKAKEMITP